MINDLFLWKKILYETQENAALIFKMKKNTLISDNSIKNRLLWWKLKFYVVEVF